MKVASAILLAAILAGPIALAQADGARRESVNLSEVKLSAQVPADVAGLIRIHNYKDAEALLISKIKTQEEHNELLKVLGGVYFLDGAYLNCASALEKARTAGVLDNDSQFTLAMAYVKLGRNDWAQAELAQLLKADPERAIYQYWSGRLDFVDQQFSAAVQKLKKATELDPRFTKAYDALGLVYEAAAETDAAVRAFDTAVAQNRANPHPSPWPPLDYGEMLFRLANFKAAQKQLAEAVQYDPQLAKAHYELGLTDEKLEQYPDSVVELNRAASLDRSYAEPYYALSRVYRKQGQEQLAQRAADTFEKLKKDR